MRICITGANSFIGKKLAETASAAGHDLILVTRPGHEKEALPHRAVRVNMEMQEYDALGERVGRCDCFVHLAWDGTRGASRMNVSLQEKNFRNSSAAVRSMLSAGCRRIIIAGSQAEYGPHTEQITEESECYPNTEYGKAKLAFYLEAERLCKEVRAEYREARIFSVYGPNDFEDTMVISTLRKMLQGTSCDLTLGLQKWDFLYIADAIEALYRLCTQPCPSGVYNFGSGDVRQLKDFILEMAEITGSDSKLQFGMIPYPPTGMVSLWPDCTKLKTELKWKPTTTFSDGIRAVLVAIRKDIRANV